MKTGLKFLLVSIFLAATTAYAANREQAQAITQQLNTFVAPSQSTTPNKALLYKSNRNNVDDTSVTTDLTIAIAPTTVTITRGESLALDRCTADYGTATVSGSTIVINTTRVPIRVLCTTADGSLRAFYTTYASN